MHRFFRGETRMQNHKRLQGLLAVLGLLIMILDSKLALEGARTGIDLCIKSVIPSLFPFFVLSMVLTDALDNCVSDPLRIVADRLQIPGTAVSVIIPAVLGGYPVGAKCVHDLFQSCKIRKEEAERLLSFCSNAGPSFLFGMVSGYFSNKRTVWILWIIHLLSAVLTAFSIPSVSRKTQPYSDKEKRRKKDFILSAAKAMMLVCCWVILFRMILTFLDQWFFWAVPEWTKVIITGILELTNGCCALTAISDENMRIVFCSAMLSFGGICVLLQTASVTDGLSLYPYIKGKLLQTVYSFLISSAIVSDHGLLYAALIPAFLVLFRKFKNCYGNLRKVPV